MGSMTRPTRGSGILLAFPSLQVSVDIFKGFPDEESIVNYTLNQAYQDNVTVFASMSLRTAPIEGSPKPCPKLCPRPGATGSGMLAASVCVSGE